MTTPRHAAVSALLELPDPIDLPSRGYVLTVDGKPDRFTQLCDLPLRHRTIRLVDRENERLQ